MEMNGYDKYERTYFMPPECTYDWVKKEYIDKAPIWCSVDLRDGNQAIQGDRSGISGSFRDRVQFHACPDRP